MLKFFKKFLSKFKKTFPQEKPLKDNSVIDNAISSENKKPSHIPHNKNFKENGKFNEGNKVAEKTLDYNLLNNLIYIFCTLEECAAVLEVDVNTINAHLQKDYGKTFSEYFVTKRHKAKSSLRRRQWQLAEKNPALAIWLGKQYLAQKDDPIIDQSVHYHYTEIKDDKLIEEAIRRGVTLPQELQRKITYGSH